MRVKLALQRLQLARSKRLLQFKFLVLRPLEILVRMRGSQNDDVVPDHYRKRVKTRNQSVQRAWFEPLGRNIPGWRQNPSEDRAGDDVKSAAKNIPSYATKANRFGDRIAVNYREKGRRQ